jgi:hypothetical protein
MKSRYSSIVFILALLECSGNQRDTTKLWTKSFSTFFNQSAYNKQWLGAEHLTWLVIWY